jgi:hypothetical protein
MVRQSRVSHSQPETPDFGSVESCRSLDTPNGSAHMQSSTSYMYTSWGRETRTNMRYYRHAIWIMGTRVERNCNEYVRA